MGKDSGSDTQSQHTTTQVIPWTGVQPGLNEAYGQYSNLFAGGSGGPQYYPGQDYITPDPMENYAQNLKAAYAMQSLPMQFGQAQQAQTSLLNAPNVASNPYVNAQADVIQDRLSRQFREQIAPRIEGGAVAAGQKGGSREAIAQALGARGVSEATGDALAGLYGDAYRTGLGAQVSGLSFAPQLAQMGMMPMQTLGDVGSYRRAISDQALQSDMNRWNYLQEQPYSLADRYLAALNQTPWGQASTAEQEVPQPSTAANAVGGGLLGYSLMGSPIGAIGGALLGGLFG